MHEIASNDDLAGCVAVVTGASSGIGRAIVLALARQSVRTCVLGRDATRLAETVAAASRHAAAKGFNIDLADEDRLGPLLQHLEDDVGRLDILVHSAGVIHQDPLADARVEDLDVQYATNVRAPYILTQRLLPLLLAGKGQIVFINSSAGLTARRPDVGQYGATKHALRAIADSLREEVNASGIRVLTVYLGRTATPMQKTLHEQEGKAYRPERLLQPEDVAAVVVNALALPRTAEVTEISIRPMSKG